MRIKVLYINQKLFSRAVIAHHKILIFVKVFLHNLQKKFQHINGPTTLDGLRVIDASNTFAGRIFYQGTS